MIDVAIDWGNTRGKVGIFEEGNLAVTDVIPNEKLEDFWHFLQKLNPDRIIFSDVGKKLTAIPQKLKDKMLKLESHLPLPLKLEYETPHTLGVDRIAAAVGAMTLMPKKNCFIIDLGSCITYDLLTQEGVFKGGSITLGVQLRLKALAEYTAGLPLVNLTEETTFHSPAQNTTSALQTGVLAGILAEISFFEQTYREQYPDLAMIICGGDLKIFESKIKERIFVAPNLTLVGLQRILAYYYATKHTTQN